MKSLILTILLGVLTSNAQDVSISGYLDKRYTVEMPMEYITDSVYKMTRNIRILDPDFPMVKFEFIGVCAFDRKFKTVTLENATFNQLLEYIASTFGYSVRYDLSKNSIIFKAVTSTGEDPTRIYVVSEQTSKNLGLDWGDIIKIQQKFFSYGISVDFKEIDLKGKMFRASGSIESLDHIDMLIYVFSKINDSKPLTE